MLKKVTKFAFLFCNIFIFLLCGESETGKENTKKGGSGSKLEIVGAGATFPYPLYSKMFDSYSKQKGIKINYQSIGSGGGIRQLTSRTVDFGATDAYMDDESLSEHPEIIHIPTCLGAVVVSYNLPGNPELKIEPDVLADIYLGEIQNWDNKRIKETNPEAKLPSKKIAVMHRSDGSGTSFIFTDYLSKVSSEWKKKVGAGKSVNWPEGLGAKGNEGVAGIIKQAKGSIGYCELAYALHNDMPVAKIRNKSGNFIKPEISSISKAAAMDIPEDTRITLTNTDAEKGYPLSSFTWLLLYKEQNYKNRSKEKVTEMVKMIEWMLTHGQKYAEPLDYAPLPEQARNTALTALKKIEYNGEQILE